MSLTSHIRDARSPIHEFLYNRFPNTRAISRECRIKLSEATTIRPAGAVSTYAYGLIGTALDYRLRYYFADTPYVEFVAWPGALHAVSPHEGIMLAENVDSHGRGLITFPCDENGDPLVEKRGVLPGRAVEGFFASLDTTIQELTPIHRRLARHEEEQINQHCVVLALFDEIFRRGPKNSILLNPEPKSSIAEVLELAEDAWIDDLCQLSWAFYDHTNGAFNSEAILNPTFDGSGDVGGADADLIVNGCLIDIKATINPKIDARWLYQLLGYTLLDYSDRYHIRSVALYMARQQMMLQWSLDDLMTVMAVGNVPSLEKMRADFHHVASEYH